MSLMLCMYLMIRICVISPCSKFFVQNNYRGVFQHSYQLAFSTFSLISFLSLSSLQEIRAAAAAAVAGASNNSIGERTSSPENNNSISKNNNTNSNNNIVKEEVNIKSEQLVGNGGGGASDSSELNVNKVNQLNDDVARHLDNGDDLSENNMRQDDNNCVNKNLADTLIDEQMICLSSRSDSDTSMPSSPGSDLAGSKDDMDIEMQLDKNNLSPVPQCLKNEPVALDIKRARVENIVSTMRSSPILPSQPINGCKKRKLYQPQQHDAERYAAVASGLNLGMVIQHLIFFLIDQDSFTRPFHGSSISNKVIPSGISRILNRTPIDAENGCVQCVLVLLLFWFVKRKPIQSKYRMRSTNHEA